METFKKLLDKELQKVLNTPVATLKKIKRAEAITTRLRLRQNL